MKIIFSNMDVINKENKKFAIFLSTLLLYDTLIEHVCEYWLQMMFVHVLEQMLILVHCET